MDVFSGASSAGLWSTGSNPMQFATNGTERMRIDSSGNVGIGSTSINAQARLHLASANTTKTALHIENTSTGGKRWDIAAIGSGVSGRVGNLQIRNDTAAANYIEIEHDTGNVGIGTTSPNRKLEVLDNILIGGASGANLYFRPNNSFSSAGNFGIFTTALTSGTFESTMTIKGYGSGVTDVMTIKGLGNVGIGTTSPSSNLHLKSNDGLLVESAGSANYGVYVYSQFNENMGGIGALSQSDGDRDGASINFRDFGRDIAFNTHQGSSNSEKMRILSTGKVGIGTSSPSSSTSSPSSSLHVHSTNYTAATFERNQALANYGVSIDLKNSEDNIFNLACEGSEDFNIGYTPSGGSKTNLFTLNSSGIRLHRNLLLMMEQEQALLVYSLTELMEHTSGMVEVVVQ
jgi:hypothetical protein